MHFLSFAPVGSLAVQASPALGLWIPVLAGFIVLLHAGFALLETGLGRAKNVAHTMSASVLVYALSITAFFAIGYALMCGGMGGSGAASVVGPLDAATTASRLASITIGSHTWGIFGARGFFLAGLSSSRESLSWFLLMAVCMALSGTIAIGANIERWKIKSIVIFSLTVGAWIYPIYAGWVWGGGWLAKLGSNLHLGHGVVDYSGSMIIQLTGGCLAFAASLHIGPRLGKYDKMGNPRPIFGHHVPMVILGTLIVSFGWFGLNCARSIASGDGQAGIIAANTTLASVAGALAAAFYMWVRYGKPDPSVMCNGLLGALVASSAGCAFYSPGAAFFVGAASGLLVAMGVLFFERKGVDDPVGAISVHGIGGLWGGLAVGLFANGTFGDGYNGVAGSVAGLLYGGGMRQLLCQLIGAVVCIIWAIGGGYITLMVAARLCGGSNRVLPEVEIAGLDIPEMGAPGYPEFTNPVGPEQVPTSQGW